MKMKIETVFKILDSYIDHYDKIINDKNETRIRKCIAENEKNLIETIKGEIANAEETELERNT